MIGEYPEKWEVLSERLNGMDVVKVPTQIVKDGHREPIGYTIPHPVLDDESQVEAWLTWSFKTFGPKGTFQNIMSGTRVALQRWVREDAFENAEEKAAKIVAKSKEGAKRALYKQLKKEFGE